MQDRECIVFKRKRDLYRSENPRAVCVFVSPVLIPSSTNRRVDHFYPTRYLSHLPAVFFLLHAAKKNNNAANFLCLWSKIIRKASLPQHIFFCFKKRPNISLYVEYSRTWSWFSEDFQFAYKTTKFYAKWLVRNLGQKRELQYLETFAA